MFPWLQFLWSQAEGLLRLALEKKNPKLGVHADFDIDEKLPIAPELHALVRKIYGPNSELVQMATSRLEQDANAAVDVLELLAEVWAEPLQRLAQLEASWLSELQFDNYRLMEVIYTDLFEKRDPGPRRYAPLPTETIQRWRNQLEAALPGLSPTTFSHWFLFTEGEEIDPLNVIDPDDEASAVFLKVFSESHLHRVSQLKLAPEIKSFVDAEIQRRAAGRPLEHQPARSAVESMQAVASYPIPTSSLLQLKPDPASLPSRRNLVDLLRPFVESRRPSNESPTPAPEPALLEAPALSVEALTVPPVTLNVDEQLQPCEAALQNPENENRNQGAGLNTPE